MINDKTVEMICSSDREVRELGAQLILNDYTDIEILVRDLNNFVYPNKDKYYIENTRKWVVKKLFDVYNYTYSIGYKFNKNEGNYLYDSYSYYNRTTFTNNNPKRKLTWMTG